MAEALVAKVADAVEQVVGAGFGTPAGLNALQHG
jgi:hypothetical protein